MQTFSAPKPLVDDPGFRNRRNLTITELKDAHIDRPINDLILDIARISCCYTMQCCWGHFVHPGQKDRYGDEPIANYTDETEIEYRIAYMALCIQNSDAGNELLGEFERIASEEPDYIQFGSADWFWSGCVNSYAIQVEPERFKNQDTAILPINEALKVEKIRTRLFEDLKGVVFRFCNHMEKY